MSDNNRAVAIRDSDAGLPVEKTRALWAGGKANLPVEVARGLATVGEYYNLDPALGEVMILGDKVYITLEGYLRIAESHPEYDGYELWPLSEDERIATKASNDEHAWGCRVYRKDRRYPAVGYGFASDATVSMSTMKPFKREVAQKRAFHRALKGSFRAMVPDPDAAIEAATVGDGVQVVEGASADRPPSPPQPNWPKFWTAVKGLDVTRDEVHQVLKVASVTEWPYSLEDAYREIEKYAAERDRQRPAQPATLPPRAEAAPEEKARPVAMNDWRALVERAEVVGIIAPSLPEGLTPSGLGAHYNHLAAKIAWAETAGQARDLGIEVDELPEKVTAREIKQRTEYLRERIRLELAEVTEAGKDVEVDDIPFGEEISV